MIDNLLFYAFMTFSIFYKDELLKPYVIKKKMQEVRDYEM
jgi:hypothetical protein